MAVHSEGDWLVAWDAEDPKLWDKSLAWKTLVITTFNMTFCFVAWFLPSAMVPKLNGLGFGFSKTQLYWLASIPGLSGGIMRLVWMVLPPILGTRKMVTSTMALIFVPMVGWGIAIQDNSTPFAVLMILGFLAGIGGGCFSGFMPSTSYFFPKRLQGTALGIQAGIGNSGVSLVQLLTPWLIGFGMFGMFGAAQNFKTPSGNTRLVHYQTAAFIYVPVIIIGLILAWFMLRSVPIKANIRQQFDIFGNQDTWWMTVLYIMTFGTFSGLSAQFGLLMANLYGTGNSAIINASGKVLISGYKLPDPVSIVFWGPLIGAATRVIFSPLTDRIGGAVWTFISAITTAIAVAFTIPYLTPDVSSAATLSHDFKMFVTGMLVIFFTTGIGNASTFKQMPMIFEKRQAGGVIGWTAAIAAFGPFLFGIALTLMAPTTFYIIGVVWAIGCAVITWVRYARPGAPRPS